MLELQFQELTVQQLTPRNPDDQRRDEGLFGDVAAAMARLMSSFMRLTPEQLAVLRQQYGGFIREGPLTAEARDANASRYRSVGYGVLAPELGHLALPIGCVPQKRVRLVQKLDPRVLEIGGRLLHQHGYDWAITTRAAAERKGALGLQHPSSWLTPGYVEFWPGHEEVANITRYREPPNRQWMQEFTGPERAASAYATLNEADALLKAIRATTATS